MRDFTWNYFAMTGDVDAYMLYKEMDESRAGGSDHDALPDDDDASVIYEDNGLG